MLKLPPLSLYIHIPWCVQKCPYCDFNSHKLNGTIPEDLYLEQLLRDLKQDLHYVQGRSLHSIFIGGGTPTTLSAATISKLLEEVEKLIDFSDNIEITIEANPGTLDSSKFKDLKNTKINRLSIGVQSFNNQQLIELGRIHDADQAIAAIKLAQDIGFTNINLDLMHGLPKQTIETALFDVQQAVELQTTHISYYQLTIEPSTMFYYNPPILPKDSLLEEIEFQGKDLLETFGFKQYEVSAYCKDNNFSQHNLNYWKFGDYIGIGCGAAGKITLANTIIRTTKNKNPKGYLQGKLSHQINTIDPKDLAFEFLMNRFRLFEPCKYQEFENATGLRISSIKSKMADLIANGFIIDDEKSWELTNKGKLFLNDVLIKFIDD